jgi:hypothetical protein
MRKHFFLLIAICGVMLTGCSQLVDLTDKESDVLAEYMAGTILKHSGNYEEALIYPENAETIEDKDTLDTKNVVAVSDSKSNADHTVSQTTQYSGDTQNLPVKSQNISAVSLTDMFKNILNNNFRVTYKNCKVYDTYMDDNRLFAIVPSKGNKIAVIYFSVKNVTKKSQKLALMNYDISYQLTDQDSNVYYPMMTLLDNDIQYLNEKIDAGKSRNAVVLFELPKNTDVSKLNLTLTYEDKISVIDIGQ